MDETTGTKPASETDKEAVFNRRFLAYFAVGLAVASFTYIACITFVSMPEKNQRFADTVLGFLLGTLLGTIITFFYGSSKSSQAKDTLIGNVAASAVPAPPAQTPEDLDSDGRKLRAGDIGAGQ
jgi:hypothetical protein